MVTGEQAQVEGAENPVVETPEETPAPQEKTFTQEEVEAGLSRLREEEIKKYQGLQKVVSRKDQQIEQLKQSPKPQSKVTNKLIDEIEHLARNSDDGLASTNRIAALKQELVKEENIAQGEAFANDWHSKINQKIIDAGYDPNDDAFVDVEEAYQTAYYSHGKFELAEKKADRILKSLQPTKTEEKVETPPITPQKRTFSDEDLEEAERLINEKKGLSVSDSGRITSGIASREDLYAKARRGEMSDEDIKKHGLI